MTTLCYDCLTDDDAEVQAVTARQGTPLCKKCANEWATSDRDKQASLEELAQRIPRPQGIPPMTTRPGGF